MTAKHVRRVDQLDSVTLDSELFALLNTQYRRAFTYVPSSVVAKFGPELDALFRFLFKYFPLKYLGCSFGQNVFDLKYFDNKTLSPASRNKLRFLVAATIVFPWLWERIVRQILAKLNDSKFRDVSYKLETNFLISWKALSLLNFCVFLQKSTFLTVIERILNVRPVYSSLQAIRQVQYDGIARELMWHGLSEFLGFALPLINVFRMKNYINRVWFSIGKNNRIKYRLKNDNCLICGGIPNYPHSMGCAHIFCYYCISSMLLVDPYYKCLQCDFSASGLEYLKPLPINRPNSVAKGVHSTS